MKSTSYVMIFAAVLSASCGRKEPERVSADTGRPVPVQTAVVRSENWPALYEASGTVHARVAAIISSKVTGYIDRVAVQQGDRVAAGQILVILDSRDLDANLRRAEAAVAEASSAIPEADSAVAASKASLDLAETTFKRMEDLFTKKSISDQEHDEATAKVKAARANYEMARAKRTQLQSRIEQADQERRVAQLTRDYSRITAPFPGIVTAKSAEPGNLAMPGTPLLTIESAGGYRLDASIDESKMSSVRPGDRLNVSLEAAGCDGAARVSEIVPAVDPSSRSYTIKIDLPPVDSSGKARPCGLLRSGMFGRVYIPSGASAVIAIPQNAVVERGQLKSVFVAEDGCARTRLVTIGQRSADSIEVLSGLTAGERVITPVPAMLTDGSKVEVQP